MCVLVLKKTARSVSAEVAPTWEQVNGVPDTKPLSGPHLAQRVAALELALTQRDDEQVAADEAKSVDE